MDKSLLPRFNTTPQPSKYVNNRNIFMKMILFFLVCGVSLYSVSISTEYWNYDPQTEFYQGVWTMYRCESFDLQTCVEIKQFEDEKVTILQVFVGLSYAILIVGFLHTLLQMLAVGLYTTWQAVVSIVLLSLSALTFIVGFGIYFQRSLVSNFALQIRLGYSAHCALAGTAMVMFAIAVYGIETARRSVYKEQSQRSLREMREMSVAGPPPKREMLPPEPVHIPELGKVTTQLTGTVIAARKFRDVSSKPFQDIVNIAAGGVAAKRSSLISPKRTPSDKSQRSKAGGKAKRSKSADKSQTQIAKKKSSKHAKELQAPDDDRSVVSEGRKTMASGTSVHGGSERNVAKSPSKRGTSGDRVSRKSPSGSRRSSTAGERRASRATSKDRKASKTKLSGVAVSTKPSKTKSVASNISAKPKKKKDKSKDQVQPK